MRTRAKTKSRVRAWAQAQIKAFTTDEICEHLDRVRTFYVVCLMDDLETGDITEASHYITMISRITSLFEDIKNGRGGAAAMVAKTIARYPLMLAPSEMIDFNHLLDNTPMADTSLN